MTREAIILNIREPLSLLVAAWRWLAAEADDLDEKRRCLEAILALEPDNERAYMALLWVLRQQSYDTQHRSVLLAEGISLSCMGGQNEKA